MKYEFHPDLAGCLTLLDFTFLSSLLRFSKVIYLRCLESPYKISKKMTVMNICDFPEIFIDFQSNLAAYLGTYQAFMMEFLGEDC